MTCIFPGCNNDAENTFGIRLRYPPARNAFWAPETDVMICDDHAVSGIQVKISLTPTETGDVEIETATQGGPTITKIHEIKALT